MWIFCLENEELEKLDVPIIINLTSGFDTNILLEEVYENVSAKLTEHMADRQNINLWTSQFEMPVYPWLMPCSNFPRCETDYLRGNDDFTYFSNVTIDIWHSTVINRVVITLSETRRFYFLIMKLLKKDVTTVRPSINRSCRDNRRPSKVFPCKNYIIFMYIR